MKKKRGLNIILILGILLIIIGLLFTFLKQKNSPKTEPSEKEKISLMHNELLEYGKIIFENDHWLGGDKQPGVYYYPLEDIEKNEFYHFSSFNDPITNQPCDKRLTRVELILKDKEKIENQSYEIRAVLYCETYKDTLSDVFRLSRKK